MDRHFIRKIFSALIITGSLAGILGSFACNTVHGLGHIERGGEKLRTRRILRKTVVGRFSVSRNHRFGSKRSAVALSYVSLLHSGP
jgi:predicted small secreted protein